MDVLLAVLKWLVFGGLAGLAIVLVWGFVALLWEMYRHG